MKKILFSFVLIFIFGHFVRVEGAQLSGEGQSIPRKGPVRLYRSFEGPSVSACKSPLDASDFRDKVIEVREALATAYKKINEIEKMLIARE